MSQTLLVMGLLLLTAPVCGAFAQSLTIYQVQYTTNADGSSYYEGDLIDCDGGIVVGKFAGYRPRVIVHDPANPDAWGGIQVKDWTIGDLFDNVTVGDCVTFSNVLVEEYRGTTMLQWYSTNDPTYDIVSQGNPLPAPVILTVADLAYPPLPDHSVTEPYESMVVTLENVIVGAMDLGKAEDNYELIQGGDVAWATDYMNVDAGAPYDPRIITGVLLESITGMVEQYTKPSDGWDYYQLCTKSADDIVVAQAIPAVSEWGMIVMSLLTISAATVLFTRVCGHAGARHCRNFGRWKIPVRVFPRSEGTWGSRTMLNL